MSSVIGLGSFLFTPRSPSDARFLSETEQIYVIDRLRHDGVAAHDTDGDEFSWVEVARAFTSPHVCLLSIASFMSGKFARY